MKKLSLTKQTTLTTTKSQTANGHTTGQGSQDLAQTLCFYALVSKLTENPVQFRNGHKTDKQKKKRKRVTIQGLFFIQMFLFLSLPFLVMHFEYQNNTKSDLEN